MTTPHPRRLTRYLRARLSKVSKQLRNPKNEERRIRAEATKDTLESVLNYLRDPDYYDGGGTR